MSSEARCVADELLLPLLEDVCRPNNCTFGGKQGSPESPAPQQWDVCSILRNHIPDQLIASFTVRHSRVSVTQLKCVEQRASGYCGHYAFYFAYVLAKACHCSHLQDAVGWLSLLNDSISFWRRYWESLGILVDHVVESDQWWPWTKEHVYSGDMERSFLAYLLWADPYIQTITSCDIIVLHYAYSLLQDSLEVLCAAQEKISSLVCSSSGYLVFILGVTNHWVTMLLYKCSPNIVGVLYLDSNNEPVLMASENELRFLVDKRESKHIQRKGKPYSEWKKANMLQGFIDQRDIVCLLQECASGGNDLRTYQLTSSWNKLIDSYEQHVSRSTETQEKGDTSAYLVLLVQWLEHHYCHTAIQRTYVMRLQGLGTQYLCEGTLKRVSLWAHHCQQYCLHTPTGIESVDVFHSSIKELLCFLKN